LTIKLIDNKTKESIANRIKKENESFLLGIMIDNSFFSSVNFLSVWNNQKEQQTKENGSFRLLQLTSHGMRPK